jgi:hypothetical protein
VLRTGRCESQLDFTRGRVLRRVGQQIDRNLLQPETIGGDAGQRRIESGA